MTTAKNMKILLGCNMKIVYQFRRGNETLVGGEVYWGDFSWWERDEFLPSGGGNPPIPPVE